MIVGRKLNKDHVSRLLQKCFLRVLIIHGDRGYKKFMEQTLPVVCSWLLRTDVNFYVPRGLLFTDYHDPEPDQKAYHGYLSYVHGTLGVVSVDDFPDEIKKYNYEDIQIASAILQLSFREADEPGVEYVDRYLHDLETSSFLRQKGRPKEIASRPRSRHLIEVLRVLVGSADVIEPKSLWLSLIQRFHDADPIVRAIFADLIPDESGLKQQNALKSAPYKFVYMESIQSGKSKGDEKYLTYQRFRTHIKKITS